MKTSSRRLGSLALSVSLLLALAGCSAGASPSPDDRAPAGGAAGGTSHAGAASTSSTKVLDLGELAPGTPIDFEVPRGALGFTVVARGDEAAWVGIQSLVSPSGVASLERFDAAGGSTEQMGLGGRGIGAFSVPQTNATATAPLETGTWRLVVGGVLPDPSVVIDKSKRSPIVGTPITSPVHVTVTVQTTDDGEFHGGALDLHVYVPDDLAVEDPGPRHAVRAAQADQDPAILARVDGFYAELQRLFGIGRGAVSFHALDASYLTANTGPELSALMSRAVPVETPALHVVLTNELQHQAVVGITLGQPGAPNLAGTRLSAISVGIYEKAQAAVDAVTILHEMGHFVGLAHTTELDLTPDLLSDTPSCDDPKLASCPDLHNLMWPDVATGPMDVSSSQVRVVRGSSIYRANAR